TLPFAPGAVFRLLGLVVMPEPAVGPVLPVEPLPALGLLCGIDGMLGTLVVLPGPAPPGTPTPPGVKLPADPAPSPPAAGPPVVPDAAPPEAAPPADPPADPPPAPPAPPPELCASASVEPAAMKANASAIEIFMSEPACWPFAIKRPGGGP